MRKIILLFFSVFFLYETHIHAQLGPKASDAVLVQLDYGFSIPMMDLKTDFGNFYSLSVTPVYYFHKPLFTIGPSFRYHFGRDLNIDAISSLRDEYGQVAGSDTKAATIEQRMRAIQLGLHISKIIDFGKGKTVSGIEIGLSAGYLQHWTRLQDDSNSTTQLLHEYSKGYDRLSGGTYIEPMLAYALMSGNELLNLKAGIKYNLAFTKNLRKYNYNTYQDQLDSRTDSFLTIFISYALPIYLNTAGESRYY